MFGGYRHFLERKKPSGARNSRQNKFRDKTAYVEFLTNVEGPSPVMTSFMNSPNALQCGAAWERDKDVRILFVSFEFKTI